MYMCIYKKGISCKISLVFQDCHAYLNVRARSTFHKFDVIFFFLFNN